jgi:hypothetical protein
MPINNLLYTDTFKTWFDTTNTVISTLNGVTVYNILAGDGISLSSSGGIFTIGHSNNVSTGVTFAGNVKFNGTVSFASSPTVSSTTINVLPKVSGLTAGNVVRVTSSGVTLAKADSRTNAEVLGIVVGEDATSNIVAVNGYINSNNFSSIIGNALGIAGGTLIAGQAYFLDPVVAGGITIVEPQTYGYVSKPMILGICGNAGALLPYRGIQIEGISAGITAELDNKIVIQIDIAENYTGNTVKIGDPVVYFTDDTTRDIGTIDNPNNSVRYASKTYGRINGSTYNICSILDLSQSIDRSLLTGNTFLGLISEILVNDGTKYILEITLPGGSFNTLISDLDTNFFTATATTKTDQLILDSSGRLETGINAAALSRAKFVDFIKIDASNAKIILAGRDAAGSGSSQFVGAGSVATSGSTAALEYDNLIPNGAFSIWQRQTTSLTAGNLNTYSTPFADRWFVVKNGLTGISGLTLNTSRQTFDSNQTSVPGSPLYYVDFNTQYSGISAAQNRPRLENVQSEARLLQGQQATLSFWAKSTVSGSTLDIVYNRYKDTYANSAAVKTATESRVNVTYPTGITLNTLWNEYQYTFTPAVAGFTLAETETGWLAVGLEFPSSTATVSLAQVQLELGGDVTEAIYKDPKLELERCSPYYLRTYDWDQNNGFTGSSRFNEQKLQIGNLNSQRFYTIPFPVETVTTPTITLYSPSGQQGDAYNVNTGKDMRYSGDGLVNLPWDTTTSRTTSAWPSPNISAISASKNGMILSILNGATHLDTLTFHYVADADLNLNV